MSFISHRICQTRPKRAKRYRGVARHDGIDFERQHLNRLAETEALEQSSAAAAANAFVSASCVAAVYRRGAHAREQRALSELPQRVELGEATRAQVRARADARRRLTARRSASWPRCARDSMRCARNALRSCVLRASAERTCVVVVRRRNEEQARAEATRRRLEADQAEALRRAEAAFRGALLRRWSTDL